MGAVWRPLGKIFLVLFCSAGMFFPESLRRYFHGWLSTPGKYLATEVFLVGFDELPRCTIHTCKPKNNSSWVSQILSFCITFLPRLVYMTLESFKQSTVALAAGRIGGPSSERSQYPYFARKKNSNRRLFASLVSTYKQRVGEKATPDPSTHPFSRGPKSITFSAPDYPRPPHAPLIRLASWTSFCIIVTRLAWMAHRLVSSNRCTMNASADSWSACMAWLCQRRESPPTGRRERPISRT